MPNQRLFKTLQEICQKNYLLLWLEGSTYEKIQAVKVTKNTLILTFYPNRIRVVNFDRYVITKVGLQFWSKGRPGVIYCWDLLAKSGQTRADPNEKTNIVLDEEANLANLSHGGTSGWH